MIFDTEQTAPWPVMSQENIYAPTPITVGDINGNGTDEVLFGTYYTGVYYVLGGSWYNLYSQTPSLFVLNGDGTFNTQMQERSKSLSPEGTTQITLANLDGAKGEETVFGASLSWSSKNSFYAMDEMGNSLVDWNAPSYPRGSLLGVTITAHNIDNTGAPELITTLRKFNENFSKTFGKEILTFHGNDGTIRDQRIMDGDKMNNPVHLIADLDNDGNDELMINSFNNTEGGQFLILDPDTLQEKFAPITFASPTDWPYPAGTRIGDLDGDGDLEIIVRVYGARISDHGWGFNIPKLYAYHHTGELVAGFPYSGLPTITGDYNEIKGLGPVADLDGDGKVEILTLETTWQFIPIPNTSSYDVDWHHQANLIQWKNGTMQNLPGWPPESLTSTEQYRSAVTTYAGNAFKPYVGSAVIGNLDADGAMEIAIPAYAGNQASVKDVFPVYLCAILTYNADNGTMVAPPKWLRSYSPSLTLGNAGGNGNMQLIAAGGMFHFEDDPANWGPRQEVSLFNFPAPYDANHISWGQLHADAQNRDIYNKWGAAKLDINPESLDFGDDPNLLILPLQIRNLGKGNLDYTLSEDLPWLSLSTAAGSVSNEVDTVYVTVDRNYLHTHSIEPHDLVTGTIDINGNGQIRQITATVVPFNSDPTARDDVSTTQEDVAKNILVLENDSDPETDTLTIDDITDLPDHGSAAECRPIC